jgi:hypothetical protein
MTTCFGESDKCVLKKCGLKTVCFKKSLFQKSLFGQLLKSGFWQFSQTASQGDGQMGAPQYVSQDALLQLA